MKPLTSTVALGVMLALGTTAPAFAADCASAGKQRSKNADSATSLTFVAKGSGQFKVYWIDYDGARVFYNNLRGGGQFAQPTFMTHPWLVTKVEGGTENCVGVFLPKKGGSTAIVK